MTLTLDRPESDIDLFSDDALADPYPLYRVLRDCAPAVFLARHDAWFLGRYQQVRDALSDWRTYSSACGIGLNPTINAAWREALICLDPPEHTEKRKLLLERLAPKYLRPVEETIDRRAQALVDRLAAQPGFDAVAEFAQDLPVNVIMDLIGWPDAVRGSLLDMAEGSFNAVGPDNARMQGSLPRLGAMMELIAKVYDEGALAPGGFGATIAEAARRGEITREAAIGLLAGYVVAAFDTTIHSVASGVWLFANNPHEWRRVCAEPSLVPAAFEEVVRLETPLQNFSRVVTRDVDLGEGAAIPAGARVIVSYAAANRDERYFSDPDRLVVDRKPANHLGFGLGVHACAGQGLARLEGHAVFRAVAERGLAFALAGEPVRSLNNIARGFARVPARLIKLMGH
ncbi:MAG: cytochrome P450 [Hydrogenophilaceae bacterium]|jgi:cytochrome P450|nr:cytochrome P450 [Hydrogenophilaceae bacterium]